MESSTNGVHYWTLPRNHHGTLKKATGMIDTTDMYSAASQYAMVTVTLRETLGKEDVLFYNWGKMKACVLPHVFLIRLI